MKCPYAVNRRTVTQVVFEYDENGNQTAQQQIEDSRAEFLTCVRQECGAWRDGRCQYREIN